MDPAELRRRNFVKPAQMPYTSAMGEKYDSGDFDLFLTKTLGASDWQGFAARKADAEKRGISTQEMVRRVARALKAGIGQFRNDGVAFLQRVLPALVELALQVAPVGVPVVVAGSGE